MDLEVTGSYKNLVAKMQRIQKEIKPRGAQWARSQAISLDHQVREHLEEQGRPGGVRPGLSPMTQHIYSVDGEPDGSGIVEHLTLEFRQEGERFVAVLGIPDGRPTMIAKVQDRGAIIPVTDRMRGFMAARYGIFIRPETTHIQIPGRHFWENSLKVVKRKGRQELRKLMRSLMS